jgi:rubrerythrin
MNKVEKLFEIFQEAAEAERQARLRYEEAASLCEDPDLKEVLLRFAEDEMRHEHEVTERFREMAEKFGGGVN